MDYKDIYNEWLASSVLTTDEKQELIGIKDDDNEIKERFAVSLAFGTAGMRGVLGMGTNRMNGYTVARATSGLAQYVTERGAKDMARGVVISYDTRKYSTEFAIICAKVLNSYGIRAYLFEDVRPVPVCSFAVRYYGAVAGIMITASHNPKIYNGYKVYGEDGAQMSPEDTAVVVKYIEGQKDYFTPYGPKYATNGELPFTPANVRGNDGDTYQNVQIIGKALDEAYFAEISKLQLSADAVAATKDKIKIVYTPIHGSGYMPVTTILKRMEIPVVTVAEQEKANSEFPTVRVPNPEEADALTLAVRLADSIGASVVIGTDPDCDRMGVAVRDDKGEFVLLNGNQTGVLLMDYILSRNAQNGTLPSNSAVVKTIVTTKLANRVAAKYGTTTFDVLTGFKYIGEKIKEWEISGEHTFMFGFEESYGCLSGTHARDKDAVVASMLFAEMTCYLANNGSSVYRRLQEIYNEFGYFIEKAFSFVFPGLDGMDKMAEMMDYIRSLRPEVIGGQKVLYVSDYNTGVTYYADGSEEKITLPRTNAVFVGLENDGWLCVRPSGTEPKLKIYLAAAANSAEEATATVHDMKQDATALYRL